MTEAMAEELKLQIHGDATLPTLIYFPGLHGDWTLNGRFRKQVLGQVRLVELTYPRTLEWSLDDYAANIELALAKNEINQGWLLGESFGSQVLWRMVGRGKFQAQGIILAGGFVRHPLLWLVRLAEKTFGYLPFSLLVWGMYAFTKYARLGHPRSPETLADNREFAARRTRLDCRAATHRLYLIAQSDPRPIASATRLPVFHICGLVDPIVPWPLVRRWLRKNCPAWRGTRIIFPADHNVLGTGSSKTGDQILNWMKS